MGRKRVDVHWIGSVCKNLAFLMILASLVCGKAPMSARALAQSSPDASSAMIPFTAELRTGPGQPIKFEHISLEEGLSQSSVYSILQDSRGFLWFGTEDGLNKYRKISHLANIQDSPDA
jgi:hypothetical protein